MLLHVGDELVFTNTIALHQLNRCDHTLTVAMIAHAHHAGVDNTRMGLENFFDFFGIDLLSSRVYALATSSKELQGAIGRHRCHVARYHVTHAVDDWKRCRRLDWVLVVAQGIPPANHQLTDFTAPRLN